MLQRFVFSALEAGLQTFATDTTLYQSLFGDLWNLDAAEVTAITDYFAAHPVTLYHGYAHETPLFPQMTVLVQSEQQPLFALGDYGGAGAVAFNSATGQSRIAAGSYAAIWQHNIQVVCIAAKQPEITFYLYEIAKAIMASAKPYFQANHLDLPSMAGSELMPMSEVSHEGDYLWQRTLSFRCQREFRVVDKNSSLGRVFSVAGLERPTSLAAANELQLITTYVKEP